MARPLVWAAMAELVAMHLHRRVARARSLTFVADAGRAEMNAGATIVRLAKLEQCAGTKCWLATTQPTRCRWRWGR